MSEGARSAFGNADTLSSTIAKGSLLSFSRLMWTGNRILFTATPAEWPLSRHTQEINGLRSVEGKFLRNYFRLQMVERNLSGRARSRKRGGGRQAIRQMERERQRLGRELHTGVGQMLAAIRLQLEVITTQFPDPPVPVRQALGRISTLASDALEQVRSISKRLHPPEWQRLTLEAALQQLWEMSGIPQRLEGFLRLETLPQEPEQEVKVLFYRAAQEALSNLTRHARATGIEMSLRAAGEGVVLKIQDNGVGFDVARLWAAPASVASGIGLRSIREQAEAIGGKLQVESGPQGTTLLVAAPYSPVDSD
jgi:two-component system NarL family sensor kinase